MARGAHMGPDPGLTEKIISGPSAFLLEDPWYRPLLHGQSPNSRCDKSRQSNTSKTLSVLLVFKVHEEHEQGHYFWAAGDVMKGAGPRCSML